MKIDFDGTRMNLSRAYNRFVTKDLLEKLDYDEKEALDKIRMYIAFVNCVFDNSDDPMFNQLDIKLKNIPLDDDEENILS